MNYKVIFRYAINVEEHEEHEEELQELLEQLELQLLLHDDEEQLLDEEEHVDAGIVAEVLPK